MKKIFILLIAISFSLIFACSGEKLEWVPTWKETSPLSTKRAGAAVVAKDGFIYVIGGVDGKNFLRTTELAKIQDDGSLGPWEKGPLLNEARGFTDAVIYKGSIYIVGGGNGPYGKNLLRTAERSLINKDGTLSPWIKEKFTMNIPRRCSKVVAVDNRIFSLGGFGGDMLNTVEHAEVLDDGTLDEWFEEGETLTELRYISGVKRMGDTIYVVGGHHQTEGVGITDVEWSKAVDEAGFQKWEKAKNHLQTGRYGLTTVAHKNRLYALGGITGAEYLDSMELSEVSADGKLGPWRFTTPISLPRAMLNAVVYKDWIYIVGGTNRDGFLKSVEYATFNETGDIGFWLKKEEAAALKKSLESKPKKETNSFPNEGTVLKTLQAARYTYVLVSKGDKQEWLAAPKAEFSAGEKIEYGKGVLMTNFYSKELKMNFPAVIFTGKVEKLK